MSHQLLTTEQPPFSRAELVAMIFILVGLAVFSVLFVAYLRSREDSERMGRVFVKILLYEANLSVPKYLAIEIIDALNSPEVEDIVVDIYKNNENPEWVDLIIRRRGFEEDEESADFHYLIAKTTLSYKSDDDQKRPIELKGRFDNFIATASGRNYGEVILKYLL